MEVRRDVFQAIADPTRRAILTLLAAQALTPGAIADNFNSSRQTISKHIQILAECRLLKSRSDGREIYYQLNPQKLKDVAEFIDMFRELWEKRLDNLDNVLKQMQKNKH